MRYKNIFNNGRLVIESVLLDMYLLQTSTIQQWASEIHQNFLTYKTERVKRLESLMRYVYIITMLTKAYSNICFSIMKGYNSWCEIIISKNTLQKLKKMHYLRRYNFVRVHKSLQYYYGYIKCVTSCKSQLVILQV